MVLSAVVVDGEMWFAKKTPFYGNITCEIREFSYFWVGWVPYPPLNEAAIWFIEGLVTCVADVAQGENI